MVISRVPSCRPRLMEVWAVIYDPGLFPDDHSSMNVLFNSSTRRVSPASSDSIVGKMPVVHLSDGYSLATPGLDPPIAYNISHDNGLVVMAFAPGTHNPPAFSIGIDVMKVRIPGRDTVASFVNSVGDQLTPLEYRSLFAGISQDETLRRFFWIWTMKEAYTKALGLGLGFDFRRVEYDIEANVVRVDNQVPGGWRFSKFVVNIEEDVYEGVVAEYLGGLETEIVHESAARDWSITYDAVEFVEKAIHDLRQE
ncbi:putative 4'-phosphopantetheinyl transferase [Lyophyllum shimeji]|uniref:holo-[acyl-carrier-protein] synthase n=1 Tax=Lyophyllum shimeji TaxID=47721 RepID=A0A9P3PCS3_LYOSH|nr:putative 4'-phosphopantetheinyl transferase [Lyophyllum shimeji]